MTVAMHCLLLSPDTSAEYTDNLNTCTNYQLTRNMSKNMVFADKTAILQKPHLRFIIKFIHLRVRPGHSSVSLREIGTDQEPQNLSGLHVALSFFLSFFFSWLEELLLSSIRTCLKHAQYSPWLWVMKMP